MYRSGNPSMRGTVGRAPGVRDPAKASYHNSGCNLIMMHDRQTYIEEKRARREAQVQHKQELERQIAETRQRKEAERARKRAEDERYTRDWHSKPSNTTATAARGGAGAAPNTTSLAGFSLAPPPSGAGGQGLGATASFPEVTIRPSRIDLTAPLATLATTSVTPALGSGPSDTPDPAALLSSIAGGEKDALSLQLERATLHPTRPLLSFAGGPPPPPPPNATGTPAAPHQQQPPGTGAPDDLLLLSTFSGVSVRAAAAPQLGTTATTTRLPSSAPLPGTSAPAAQGRGSPLRTPGLQLLSLGLTSSQAGLSRGGSGGATLAPHTGYHDGTQPSPALRTPTVAFLEPGGTPQGGGSAEGEHHAGSTTGVDPHAAQPPDLLAELATLATTAPLVAAAAPPPRRGGTSRPAHTSDAGVRSLSDAAGGGEEEGELAGSLRLITPGPPDTPQPQAAARRPAAGATSGASTLGMPVEGALQTQGTLLLPPAGATAARGMTREEQDQGAVGGGAAIAAQLRCTGSVFELLTEADVRRGGEVLRVDLVGEGVLIESAPDFVLRAMSSTAPEFDAAKHDILPRAAWMPAEDGKSFTCVLQPCPSFSVQHDVAVQVPLPPCIAHLPDGAPDAERFPSSPEAFFIKSLEDFGCM